MGLNDTYLTRVGIHQVLQGRMGSMAPNAVSLMARKTLIVRPKLNNEWLSFLG